MCSIFLLMAKKDYPVYLDSKAMTQEKISISAGVRGEQLILAPADLVKAAKAVAEITNVDCTILNDEYITSDLLSLVGCMDILISIRLHALIFAGVMNVPMIGISYDPKIDRFLDSIGENPIGDLENITAEKIFKAVEKILQNKNSKSRDSELLKNLHDKARLNAELAIDLIRN